MGVTAGGLDRDDLVEHRAVAAGQERAAVDHHVHLVGPGRDRVGDVGQLHRQADPPDGNAVATLATCTPLPASASTAMPARSG